jgi:protein-S-isoprenylcysteine O-methyltransferase Ste14
MDELPDEKPLETTSFVIHATRGVVRDPATRRKMMLIVLVSALVLLFAGSTFLAGPLNPHEHPGWFIFFWIVCGWLTCTAILLAIFDLLMTRLEARKAERDLREVVAKAAAAPARSTIDQSSL